MRYLKSLLAAAASTLICAPAASAQPVVVTYVLDDVWLLPDISHPGDDARQMTGTFEWTYEVGDFENGSGEFVELSLPWWGADLPPLDWTIEQSSIEIVMPGKYHDLGVDVTLFLLDPLSLDQPSLIDTVRSKFEIEVGVIHKGHVVSGSVVPQIPGIPGDFDNDGLVGTSDLLILLGSWGACPPEGDCAADLDNDGLVGTTDLLVLLGNWG